MYLWIFAAVLFVLIILDLFKIINVIHPLVLVWWIPLAANIPFGIYFIVDFYGSYPSWQLGIIMLQFFYFAIRLFFFPVVGGTKVGTRLRTLIGAKPIIYADIYLLFAQIVILFFAYKYFRTSGELQALYFVNLAYSVGCHILLMLNGVLRLCICSRLNGIIRKVLLVISLWIPVLNWIIWIPAVKTLTQEFKEGRERVLWEETIKDSDICETKYPLLMVHGVGFRDVRIMNYWGRIPRYLKKYGAELHYGNQEGLGTIQGNGEFLKQRIEEILESTGAEKVNIIAHSKGGLDSRYTISSCGMGDKVASLTTMNSPHRGCKFADVAIKNMNRKLYGGLSRFGDAVFRVYGDLSPDFYNTMHQFRTQDIQVFNDNNPDDPNVYYQSYTSVMKKAGSDRTLSIPFHFIKKLGEENDGLVSIDSAKWGEFKGVLRNKHKRGISHADIIDLHKEDIKGFNVFEVYINIVADLKQRGF